MSVDRRQAAPVILAAMEMEIKPLLTGFKKVPGNVRTVYEGEIEGRKTCAVITGIGSKAAAGAAKWVADWKPSFVMNLGFAGGLSASLKAGEPFLPETIRDLGGEKVRCNPFAVAPEERKPAGVLLSHPSIVQSSDEKKALSPLADAVDMESFFMASILAAKGIPYFCVKVVSDTADETFPFDFSPAIEDGKLSNAKVVGMMTRRPDKIFPVMKFAFRSMRITMPLCRLALSAFRAASGD